jgi:3-hydroxybutyryl-CoA dehydratase
MQRVAPRVTGTLAHTPPLSPISIGMVAELQRSMLREDVAQYSALLGDNNPLHLDDEYASKTRFKRTIAHGMLSAGLIPTIFGSTIRSSVYVSQDFRFKNPVFVGDTVLAKITVLDVARKTAGYFATCETLVMNVSTGLVAIEGKAVCLCPLA